MRDFSFVFSVADCNAGRLDKAVLARAPGASRALVAACFARGGVQAGGRVVAKSACPALGTEIIVRGLGEVADRAVVPEPEASLRVSWSGDGLIALDKPAGQPCHPIEPGERGSLAAAFLARYPEAAGVGDDSRMPGFLHRIDSGTSGLVLAAVSKDAWEAARAQFSARKAVKMYLARVEGHVKCGGGVSGWLAHSPSFRGRMRVVGSGTLPSGERAMFAETFYRPVSSDASTTLLEVSILTGVTHQIRCQLSSIGHPIAGDALYGARNRFDGPHGPWHMLHSLSVRLETTSGVKTVRVSAPDWA